MELLSDFDIFYRDWAKDLAALVLPPDTRLVLLNFSSISTPLIECARHLHDSIREKAICVGLSASVGDFRHAMAAGLVCFLIEDEPIKVQRGRIDAVMRGEISLPASCVPVLMEIMRHSPPARPPLKVPLSDRETELLHSLACGASVRQSAEALGVSYNTGVTYVRRLYQKMGVRSRIELIKASERLLVDNQHKLTSNL
jgi:two-component system response regulator DesR